MSTMTTIGRSRFGGNSIALVTGSILIGAVASSAIGFAGASMRDDAFLLSFFVFLACTLPVTSMLGWVILVDRSTIAGTVDKPEDSVETHWYNEATKGAFQDTMFTLGITTFVLAITQFEVGGLNLGLGFLMLMMFDFLIRFQLAKRAG